MIHIQCPDKYPTPHCQEVRLFLGGAIAMGKAPLWQNDFVQMMSGVEGCVFNPRRKDYDFNDPTLPRKQIQWEHDHWMIATHRLFWFAKESICPITLLELGRWMQIDQGSDETIGTQLDHLFVGMDPEYEKRVDVEIQLELEHRQDVTIVYTLADLANQVIKACGKSHEPAS